MRASLLAAVAAVAVCLSASAAAQPEDLIGRATAYLEAQRAVMERNAGPPEVDKLLRFYTPDYVYRDARVGITRSGLDEIRAGTSSHLAETSNPIVDVESVIVSGNAVAMRVHIAFKLAATGQTVERTNIVVLRFSGDKIAERIDL